MPVIPFDSAIPWCPSIKAFVLRFITEQEAIEIFRQFCSSWESDMQVIWTGLGREVAQKWADDRKMRTLSTAMGPLVSASNVTSATKRTTYMRGASALFAWFISTADTKVTILCPPPPQRFNPEGRTNMQMVELPVLYGVIGTCAISRMTVIHPEVKGAEDAPYQLWPIDEKDQWLKKFQGPITAENHWPLRKTSTQVCDVEEVLVQALLQICRVILPRTDLRARLVLDSGTTNTLLKSPLKEAETIPVPSAFSVSNISMPIISLPAASLGASATTSTSKVSASNPAAVQTTAKRTDCQQENQKVTSPGTRNETTKAKAKKAKNNGGKTKTGKGEERIQLLGKNKTKKAKKNASTEAKATTGSQIKAPGLKTLQVAAKKSTTIAGKKTPTAQPVASSAHKPQKKGGSSSGLKPVKSQPGKSPAGSSGIKASGNKKSTGATGRCQNKLAKQAKTTSKANV